MLTTIQLTFRTLLGTEEPVPKNNTSGNDFSEREKRHVNVNTIIRVIIKFRTAQHSTASVSISNVTIV